MQIEMRQKPKSTFTITAVCIIPAVILLWMLIFFDQSQIDAPKADIISTVITLFGVAGCVTAAIIMKAYGKLCEGKFIALILLAAFFVRLGYVIRCPYNINQHDVEGLNSNGHLSYIYRLAAGDGLPDSNNWQYCHPPLHHILASGVFGMSQSFGITEAGSFENIQLLTLLYSHFTTAIWCLLLRNLHIKRLALFICCGIIAFHPTFTILAASINNDILTIMLSSAAIYFLFKWYSKPSVKYALLIGTFTGLAMMSKFSAALIAIVAAITVLIRFASDKEYKTGAFFAQTASFLATVLPLGLWYQVRNMIKFGQPLGYVAPLSTESQLYTGNESLISRFLIAPETENLKLFCDPWNDVNIIAYTLRCSIFGEYKWGSTAICTVLLLLNAAMIVLALTAAIVMLTKYKGYKDWRAIIFSVIWVVHVAFFVYFYLSSPFGCTMDFRYAVPTVLANVGLLALCADKMQCSDRKWVKAIFGCMCAVSVAFCIFSVFAIF